MENFSVNRCNQYVPDFEEYRRSFLDRLMKKSRAKFTELQHNAFRGIRDNKNPQMYLSNQFMIWDYLITPQQVDSRYIPVDIPFGKRCMLVNFNGKTIVFTKSGEVFIKFNSAILHSFQFDCIFSNNSLYAIDVLYWNEVSFIKSPASQRLSFISHLLQYPLYLSQTFLLLKPISSEKTLFFLSTSKYVLGITSNVLIWKPKIALPEFPIEIKVFYKKNSQISTRDRYCIGDIADENDEIRYRDVIVCEINGVGCIDPPRVTCAKYVRKTAKKPDLFSKILWKSTQGVTQEDLKNAYFDGHLHEKGGDFCVYHVRPLFAHKHLQGIINSFF